MKNLNNKKMMQKAAVNWLIELHNFNVFGTITFKQGMKHPNGMIEICTREQLEKTCMEVGKRIKKILKSKYGSLVNSIYWITSIENGHGDKRFHAHMIFEKPMLIDLLDFESSFGDVCSRMDKIHNRIDLREIENIYGDGSVATTKYILKEGIDAIAMSGSFIRQ